jgi:AcrR family transcriptional regulator
LLRTSNSAGAKTKEKLILKALDYILANGLRDHSLRSLSAELGTSHRLLSYHFGSKEEFINEIIKSFFNSWLEIISATDIEGCESSSDALLLLWDRISHPDTFIYSRIGFELIAWKEREGTMAQLMPESLWSEPLERISRLSSLSPAKMESDVRVMRIVVRGLIYQLAATDDPRECRRTLMDFLDWRSRAIETIKAEEPDPPPPRRIRSHRA